MRTETVGDLAIVLHSHMPYVEGFGTYPFGEEWLFDAFARSHLPVLGIARELTGKRRNRLFVYERYLGILNEGIEG